MCADITHRFNCNEDKMEIREMNSAKEYADRKKRGMKAVLIWLPAGHIDTLHQIAVREKHKSKLIGIVVKRIIEERITGYRTKREAELKLLEDK